MPSGGTGSLGHVPLQMRSVVCSLFLNDTEAHGHAEGTQGSAFGALCWRSRSERVSGNSWICQAADTRPSQLASLCLLTPLPVTPHKTSSTRAVSFQKGQDSPANLQNRVGAGSSSIRARLATTWVPPCQSWEEGMVYREARGRWGLVFPARLDAQLTSFTGSSGAGNISLGGPSQLL